MNIGMLIILLACFISGFIFCLFFFLNESDAVFGDGFKTGLAAVLALPAGFFILSLVSYAKIVAGMHVGAIVILLLMAMAFLRYSLRYTWSSNPSGNAKAPGRMFLLCLVTTVLLGFSRYKVESLGSWDAYSVWNLHAKFIYYADSYLHFKTAFSEPALAYSHLDYPLLVPLAVSSLWECAGEISAAAPFAVQVVFTTCACMLLFLVMAKLVSASAAFFSWSLLLASKFFLTIGAWQYADVPLAFFILATLALWHFSKTSGNMPTKAQILAGVFASAAAWTKNEGIPFFTLTAACLFVECFTDGWKRSMKSLVRFFLGAAPGMCVLTHFKISLRQPNDLINEGIFQKFFGMGLGRTWNVAHECVLYLANANLFLLCVLVLLLLLVLIRLKPFLRTMKATPTLLPVVLMPMVYFMTYCITPHDLKWHISTSLERLVAHLFPSMIFVVAAGCRRRDGPAAKTASPEYHA
jgi:hypothetical protein